MGSAPGRRAFLNGLAAGALIIGFDLVSRNWVAAAQAAAPVAPAPPLKGRLLVGNAALSAGADDFGHIVHRRPRAVLQPGDIGDIVIMLRFSNEHGILAAPRGEGHATYGQAQAASAATR